MTSIKNELTGAWKLLSYIEISTDGADSFFPLGNTPNGILIYSADGYMSVQIAGTDDKEETLLADSAKYLDINYRNFLVFSGSYHTDNRQATVVHEVITSVTPALIGKTVERDVTFEADILYLKSTRPILSHGKMVNSYMTWQRMEKPELIQRKDHSLNIAKRKINIL
ncbi:lipocalin-like domain-containing protein [Sphingobacterium sp. lm-10]|uniref:lipocalin-like domain-containing protein n=1 Tax=Sphingobacterium sp. lm-10 TaxID=2944904 RepID=UPI00201FC87C|nr:lipocalin-like domain-containing protein [Sphingobacterium sp. lm-10]MCL7986869.1 lipocalin-like domain-containing protein [Sphingobacterium sp. lm-10]